MIPIETIEELEYEYIHKYFQEFLPFKEVQALIPFNPSRIPAHIGGSIISQDLAMSTDIVTKPIQNLRIAYNYVGDGHNVTHTVKRLGEVAYDTAKINLMAEGVPIAGPAVSGQMANSCAHKYTKKMVEDYKLVDSIKKKCIERNWAKRFGSKFVSARTNHRPGPAPGGWKPSPGSVSNTNVSSIIINPPNATAATSNHYTRRIFSKKFRGGGNYGCEPGGSLSNVSTVAAMNFIRNLKLIILLSLIISTIVLFLYRKYKTKKPLTPSRSLF